MQGRHHRAIHAHDAVVGGVVEVGRHVDAVRAGREQVDEGSVFEGLRHRLADADALARIVPGHAGTRPGVGSDAAAGLGEVAQQRPGVDPDAIEAAAGQARFDHGRSESDGETAAAHARYIQRSVSDSGVGSSWPITAVSLLLLPASVSTSLARTKAGLTCTSMR